MVWGAIGWDIKSDLEIIDGNLNGARYRDEILNRHVRPLAGQMDDPRDFILVDDNARPHRNRDVDQYLLDEYRTHGLASKESRHEPHRERVGADETGDIQTSYSRHYDGRVATNGIGGLGRYLPRNN